MWRRFSENKVSFDSLKKFFIINQRWLAEVAMLRFDHLSGMLTGLPRGLKFEDGSMLNMDGIVNEHIQDETHVWVILKGC